MTAKYISGNGFVQARTASLVTFVAISATEFRLSPVPSMPGTATIMAANPRIRGHSGNPLAAGR